MFVANLVTSNMLRTSLGMLQMMKIRTIMEQIFTIVSLGDLRMALDLYIYINKLLPVT